MRRPTAACISLNSSPEQVGRHVKTPTLDRGSLIRFIVCPDVVVESNLDLLSQQASTVENPPPDWSSLVAATDMPDFDLSVFSDVFDLDFAAVMSNVRYDAAGVWQGGEAGV